MRTSRTYYKAKEREKLPSSKMCLGDVERIVFHNKQECENKSVDLAVAVGIDLCKAFGTKHDKMNIGHAPAHLNTRPSNRVSTDLIFPRIKSRRSRRERSRR